MKAHIHFKESAYGYREPKPKEADFTTGNKAFDEEYDWRVRLVHAGALQQWQKTARKIVEPEYKVGELLHEVERGYHATILEIMPNGKLKLEWKNANPQTRKKIFISKKNKFSHYYEGQNDIEFQHVKKAEIIDKELISDKFNSTTQVLKYSTEWQPVEEPRATEAMLWKENSGMVEAHNKAVEVFQSQIDKKEIQLKEI